MLLIGTDAAVRLAVDPLQEGAYPETKVITIGQFRIGLCHGHQVVPWGDQHSLAALQRKVQPNSITVWHLSVLNCFFVDFFSDERGHSGHGAHSCVSVLDLLTRKCLHWLPLTTFAIVLRSHIRTENGKWFVNPGSITGAFSSSASEVVPSFMLMALQGPKVVAFLYELKGDNVAVSKSEFTKET